MSTVKQKQSVKSGEIANIAIHQLKFTESESLGEGSFGKCKVAIYNKHKVCVKALKRDFIDEAHLLREGRLLSTLHHQYIPHCIGVCRTNMMLVLLVMPLHTVKGKPLALDAAMNVCGPVMGNRNGIKYLYQTATALTYMHGKGYSA